MSPTARRNTPYEQSVSELGAGVVPEGPRIIRKDGNPEALSARNKLAGDEPPAFQQAQEKGWEDLAQRGEVGQQPMWQDMGAHLNKPGQRGGGPGKAPSDLWSRESNLELARMHKSGAWPTDIAAQLSERFGKKYSEDQVARQLESLGVVGGNRKLPPTTTGEWQPDALAILQSDRIKGMSAADVAKLIEQETGQVATKNSVIGKLNRLRQETQRTDLAEDLAMPDWASRPPEGVKLPEGTHWDAKLNKPRHKDGTFVEVP